MKMIAPNGTGEIRNDEAGLGHYGAARGSRLHQGVDFTVYPGQGIVAPFPCYIKRIGFPYRDDRSFKLVEIRGTGDWKEYTAKIMYVRDIAGVGEHFNKGEILALADDITRKYGPTMIAHVHMEVRRGGVLIDFTPMLQH